MCPSLFVFSQSFRLSANFSPRSLLLSYKPNLEAALDLVFEGIERLKALAAAANNNRCQFTIDGRLVGDIGEYVASMEYDIILDEKSKPGYDGKTSDGRSVQIKATFQNQLTYKSKCDYYLGLRFRRNGTYEQVFNGPGHLIYDRYAHRKDIGAKLLSFPVEVLRELSKTVPDDQRIPLRREAAGPTPAKNQ